MVEGQFPETVLELFPFSDVRITREAGRNCVVKLFQTPPLFSTHSIGSILQQFEAVHVKCQQKGTTTFLHPGAL